MKFGTTYSQDHSSTSQWDDQGEHIGSYRTYSEAKERADLLKKIAARLIPLEKRQDYTWRVYEIVLDPRFKESN